MKLELKNVHKAYGHHKALHNLCFTIPECKSLVILGPSGGGKSSLLRMLAGLDKPDSGELLIDGLPIPIEPDKLTEYRKTVGIVFQSFNLFPHLSALDNIALPLMLVFKFSEEEAKARAIELLKRFELESHAGKMPSQLSGGQCQRVAIVRAIAVKRKLLLFDEPTSALDPYMISEVLDLIVNLKDENIVIATHHMGFAKKIADYILFLSDGAMVECDPKDQFFTSAKSPTTQQFLANILKY